MAGNEQSTPPSLGWRAITEQGLLSNGVDPSIAETAEQYSLHRADAEQRIEAHQAVIAASQAAINEETTKINDAWKQIDGIEELIRTGANSESSVVTRIVSGYLTRETTPDEMIKRARFATTVKMFDERLQANPGTPVMHAYRGLMGTDVVMSGARATGEPLTIEERYFSGAHTPFTYLVVPSNEHVTASMPVYLQNTMTTERDEGALAHNFPYYGDSKFYSDADTITERETLPQRQVVRGRDLWIQGEDAIKELARILAKNGEYPYDSWGFKHTRLETVANSELLALRHVMRAIGVEIEEVPLVHERFEEWRELGAQWAAGDTSGEPDKERLAVFNKYNDDHDKKFDSRPELIAAIQLELAA